MLSVGSPVRRRIGLNEIGRVQLRTTVPLLCDPDSKNRTTGSFILIDEATGVPLRTPPVAPDEAECLDEQRQGLSRGE